MWNIFLKNIIILIRSSKFKYDQKLFANKIIKMYLEEQKQQYN